MAQQPINDPKTTGSLILRDTGCRVGQHAFTWTGGSAQETPANLVCNCGLYFYQEWLKILADSAIRKIDDETATAVR